MSVTGSSQYGLRSPPYCWRGRATANGHTSVPLFTSPWPSQRTCASSSTIRCQCTWYSAPPETDDEELPAGLRPPAGFLEGPEEDEGPAASDSSSSSSSSSKMLMGAEAVP